LLSVFGWGKWCGFGVFFVGRGGGGGGGGGGGVPFVIKSIKWNSASRQLLFGSIKF